ncbi:unnamed protein product [Gongylonema pulchrum]|uniref:Lateral signaling target protein 2 homolog n=1 Tax=Gongylonema pulchrum TaxID=637853 RepID=A0A3P7NNR1_9BILA|nr:unnamed protein product [Gongylonema pulchrum]
MFVCISGVADQLQTNYPADLRRVLKMVLQPVDVVPVYEVHFLRHGVVDLFGLISSVRWVPDSDCEQCTACSAPFTLVRRRHHCRNCGRIFCSRCSSNSLPLPELGYDRKVRVCNLCFLYKINPFSPCPGAPNSSRNHPDNGNNSAAAATAGGMSWFHFLASLLRLYSSSYNIFHRVISLVHLCVFAVQL